MVFMMLSAVATVSIGYTNFVQAEIKEDVGDLKLDVDELRESDLVHNEKMSNIQISQAEMRGDIKLILSLLENNPPN